VRGFLFSVYSLRLRKQKQKASADGRVKNYRRPLFRVYKRPGRDPPKTSPEPFVKFKLEGKTVFPFLERLAHAQQMPHESPVLSH
jgi:hypothetical protein